MRTKIGDWVRICFDHTPGTHSPIWDARLSYGPYEVEEVISDNLIHVFGLPADIKSWVLCADMKEHAL